MHDAKNTILDCLRHRKVTGLEKVDVNNAIHFNMQRLYNILLHIYLYIILISNITSYIIGMQPSLVSSATSASSSGVSSEEKVPLGHGVFCSKAAYNKLINVEDSHAD